MQGGEGASGQRPGATWGSPVESRLVRRGGGRARAWSPPRASAPQPPPGSRLDRRPGQGRMVRRWVPSGPCAGWTGRKSVASEGGRGRGPGVRSCDAARRRSVRPCPVNRVRRIRRGVEGGAVMGGPVAGGLKGLPSSPAGQVPAGVPPSDPSATGGRAPGNGAWSEAEDRTRRAASRVDIRSEALAGVPVRAPATDPHRFSLALVGPRPTGSDRPRRHPVAGRQAAHSHRPVPPECGRPDPPGRVRLRRGSAPADRKAPRPGRPYAGPPSRLRERYADVTVHRRDARGRGHRARAVVRSREGRP